MSAEERPGIEITDAMIAAGVEEYKYIDRSITDYEDIVTLVYLAMAQSKLACDSSRSLTISSADPRF